MSGIRNPTLGDWLTLLVMTLFWGTSFMFTDMALRSFPPAVLVAVRIGVALLILMLMLRIKGSKLPPFGRAWLPFLILALFSYFLPFNLIAWSQQHVDSSMTAVLLGITPLMVIAMAHYFVQGDALTIARIVGFVIGFAGVVVVIGPEVSRVSLDNKQAWGMLAILLAAFSYSAGSIYARRLGQHDSLSTSVGVLLLASLVTLPGMVVQAPESTWPPLVESALAVLFLGSISTGLASVLFFRLIQGPGPAFLSLVNYMVPAWAVLFGATVLGESIGSRMILGMALILGGIGVSEGSRQFKSS